MQSHRATNPTAGSPGAEMCQQFIRALRSETCVNVLSPSDSSHHRASGIIVALLQDGCKLQLREKSADCPNTPHGEDVVLELVFADGTHSFSTHLTTVAGSNTCLAAWPTPTKHIERRRSKRRAFASGTTVEWLLKRDAADSVASGVLLNLSADGLACLIPTDQRHDLHTGGTLYARFRPQPRDDVMLIESRIASILDAGTQGHRIMGVEFVANDAYATLRPALMAAVGLQEAQLKAAT